VDGEICRTYPSRKLHKENFIEGHGSNLENRGRKPVLGKKGGSLKVKTYIEKLWKPKDWRGHEGRHGESQTKGGTKEVETN